MQLSVRCAHAFRALIVSRNVFDGNQALLHGVEVLAADVTDEQYDRTLQQLRLEHSPEAAVQDSEKVVALTRELESFLTGGGITEAAAFSSSDLLDSDPEREGESFLPCEMYGRQYTLRRVARREAAGIAMLRKYLGHEAGSRPHRWSGWRLNALYEV